jgi:hypothetical protein
LPSGADAVSSITSIPKRSKFMYIPLLKWFMLRGWLQEYLQIK